MNREPASDLLRALTTATPEDVAAWRRLIARVGFDRLATWLSPAALGSAVLADTGFAQAMLEALRGEGEVAACVAAAFPEVGALAAPMPPQVEHDVGSDRPLLDHIATRLLGRKLAGLEARDLARFQDRGLSAAAFDRLADATARVLAAGLGPALRAAILHLDIAKTTSAPPPRELDRPGPPARRPQRGRRRDPATPRPRARMAARRTCSASSRSRGSRRTASPVSTSAARARS